MNTLSKINLLICSFTALLYAGVGGKLAGVVTSENGEPLIGVNIVIEGSELGAASDANGHYFILNIPPGRHTVKYMMIGFKTSIHQDVAIMSDFTTRQNVILEQTVLEAEEEIIVIATRPLIQKDATSSVKVIQADEIVDMPVVDFKDVLVTQAGFTEDASGGIHVRGGRTKEILYMIDGVVVKDPLRGDFTGSVNQNAIQEMTIISGTFNAEYGQAMSSIVNIVTKEGGEKFKGKIEYISDRINEFPFHSPRAFSYILSDYEEGPYQYINLKDNLFNYLDEYLEDDPARYVHTTSGDTILPIRYVYTSSGDTVPVRIEYPEPLKPIFSLRNLPIQGSLSLNMSGKLPFGNTYYFISGYYSTFDNPLPHGIDINQDVQIKLTSRLTPKIKLSSHLHSSSHLYQKYSHPWKYQPLHQAHKFETNDRLAFTLTHSLQQSLYYTLSLAHQKVGLWEGVMSKYPHVYEKPQTDESVYFYDLKDDDSTGIFSGDEKIYNDDRSVTNSIQFDIIKQVNHRHLLKSGFNYNNYTINIYSEEEPWIGGTNFRDDTTYAPTEGSFYIQDKIEYDYLIINLGLRYDLVNPNAAMWENINRFVEWDSTTNQWVATSVNDVKAQSAWSPRIGLAYPVTEKTIFHFSYGHFFQSPSFDAMYHNSSKDITASLPLVGNPKVKPEKTVAFETGLKQALSNSTVVELTVWSKDIRDLLSTFQLRYLSNQVIVFHNTDYASVKGIDLAIHKRFLGYFGGSLNYSLSIAKGNNSQPTDGYFSAYFKEEVPHQEFFLEFDQRHDISLNLSLKTPTKFGPVVLGSHPMSNINANLLINSGSGLPYTPYVDPTIQVDINSARKPWTFSTDLRIKKRFSMQSVQVTGFMEITNLTDYENVLEVNSRTGKPFDSAASGYVSGTDDSNFKPSKIGPGRSIKAGLSFSW